MDLLTKLISTGNENCLFLNVYTKSLEPDSKLPVMVFIHGGGFMFGDGNAVSYGPHYLVQHDVVLVTINYRLEVLGFLNLEIPEVPGNAGLKDQVAALRWVKKNIVKFGGDPDSITLHGQSAGAASAIYHVLSPMSNGLFKQVIAHSATPLANWAFDSNDKEKAFRVGKVLGKETNDTQELFTFLQSVPVSDLTGLTFKLRTKVEKDTWLAMYFLPVVEKSFDGVEPFLTAEPLDIIHKGSAKYVPMILGYTSAEGLYLLNEEMQKAKLKMNNLQYLVPKKIALKKDEGQLKQLGERIKHFYVGRRTFSWNTANGIVKMLSDVHFLYSVIKFAELYAMRQPLYVYRFNYETELNLVKIMNNLSYMKGASHSDDLYYIFQSLWTDQIYRNRELRKIRNGITKMWTDFAKTG